MPYIEGTKFGSVTIDGKKYFQVLIMGDEVKERESEKLKQLFGTFHKVGDWEIKALLEKNNPEIIVVGTGQQGCLEPGNVIKAAKKHNIEIIADITPQAIQVYNENVKQGKRVNALIHTTC
ncbi:MTH938/NDUFAF3 family protein [Patescibacteria group bacterium AH-259-L05]|nr:MTH938/NDUFAF3 family protein [Patescibacteria group bacterium AH-259-L05]